MCQPHHAVQPLHVSHQARRQQRRHAVVINATADVACLTDDFVHDRRNGGTQRVEHVTLQPRRDVIPERHAVAQPNQGRVPVRSVTRRS